MPSVCKLNTVCRVVSVGNLIQQSEVKIKYGDMHSRPERQLNRNRISVFHSLLYFNLFSLYVSIWVKETRDLNRQYKSGPRAVKYSFVWLLFIKCLNPEANTYSVFKYWQKNKFDNMFFFRVFVLFNDIRDILCVMCVWLQVTVCGIC